MATETKQASAVRRPGTAKTEAIIGAGANKLEQATKNIAAASAEISKLLELANTHSLTIADQETKIADLRTKHEETKRQLALELELEVKQNREKVAREWALQNACVIILSTEYQDLKAAASENEETRKAEINAAVHAATGSMKSNHESALRLKEAEFKAQEAENRSKITQLEKEVVVLNAQVAGWQKQLEEERKASIERAKAAQVGAINVSSPGR